MKKVAILFELNEDWIELNTGHGAIDLQEALEEFLSILVVDIDDTNEEGPFLGILGIKFLEE